MTGPFECPKCKTGRLILKAFFEDYLYDWEGTPERDLDGIPYWVEFAAYHCANCDHAEQRIHRFLGDDENPEVTK